MLRSAFPASVLHRGDTFVAYAVIILSFLPYVALPLGSNTNLPISSVFAAYLILRFLRQPTIFRYTVAALATPLIATAFRLLIQPHRLDLAPYVTWFAYALPLTAMAAVVLQLKRRIIPVLSLTIGFSSVIGLVQRGFLERNILPWQWYYQVPGYASIEAQAYEIANYNHRAFGLFPEPSFMAGTLLLTTFLLLALLVYWGLSYSWREIFALVTVTPALLFSSSGTVVPTLVFLLAACFAPLRSYLRPALALSPGLAAVAGYVGFKLLQGRVGSSFNFSWYDRSASIIIALHEWISTPIGFFLGLGRGMINVYYERHQMPLDKSEHYHEIVDVFSVLLRILIENGIFGAGLLCLMSVPFFRFRGRASAVVQASSWISWIIVAGFTITYDSAFWLWGLPGALLGLHLLATDESSADCKSTISSPSHTEQRSCS